MSLRTSDDNVVDLTGGEEGDTAAVVQQPEAKRQKTEKNSNKIKPKDVYLVIHDKEPQDSCSDYRHSSFLPGWCDTQIVGIYTSYQKAERAAQNYLIHHELIDVDNDDASDAYDETNENHERWRKKQFRKINWLSNGWYREEHYDVNEMNDRVHIQKKIVE